MTVSAEELERCIGALDRAIGDRNAGIYGPGSISWKVGREALLFLGGGRAAFLQLAHPAVAHAIVQHSATKQDPAGRFKRTFDHVFGMTFGDFDSAVKSARRLHAIHTRIRGTIDEDVGAFSKGSTYEANDEHALLWVFATLLDSQVLVYELFLGTLGAREKDELYEEGKRFARLFGVSDAVLPADWTAFRRYFDRMLASDAITAGRAARETASFLLTVRRPSYGPMIHWLTTLTAAMLPPRLREEFGLGYGPIDRAVFHSTVRAIRATHRLLPKKVRYQPAYFAAKKRLRGETSRDRFGEWLEFAAGGLLTQEPLLEILRAAIPARS